LELSFACCAGLGVVSELKKFRFDPTLRKRVLARHRALIVQK